MRIGKRKPSGREKDDASIKLLEKLREKLYAESAAARRWAAFNLSWMQEDGLEILEEVLFGDSPRTIKNAAAYGLRSMRGRMKKKVLEVLARGRNHRNRDTREVCRNALSKLEPRTAGVSGSEKKKTRARKYQIKEIPSKSRGRRRIHRGGNGNINPARSRIR